MKLEKVTEKELDKFWKATKLKSIKHSIKMQDGELEKHLGKQVNTWA